MRVFFHIIEYMIIAWSGYLLSAKTKMKMWELVITQMIIGSVTIFVGVVLMVNKLI